MTRYPRWYIEEYMWLLTKGAPNGFRVKPLEVSKIRTLQYISYVS